MQSSTDAAEEGRCRTRQARTGAACCRSHVPQSALVPAGCRGSSAADGFVFYRNSKAPLLRTSEGVC